MLAAIVLAGCSFHANGRADGGGPGSGDAAGDAFRPAIDAPAACASWQPHGFDPCMLGAPGSAVALDAGGSPYTYDTTVAGGTLFDSGGNVLLTSPLTLDQVAGPTLAVLSVDGFTLGSGALLNVIGAKPLLLASWGDLEIDGTFDAGSHLSETDGSAHVQQTTQLGAGAGSGDECAPGAGVGLDATADGGAGGGGGGALAGSGGSGGSGDTGCNSMQPCPRTGGPAGAALAVSPDVARGGCPGANTGLTGGGAVAPATTTTIALGGGGGGAVHLASPTTLTVSGGARLIAGGAGGAGAPQGSAVGGGGGGAGGYLFLDAPTVTAMGVVAANGGGGGGGAPFAGFGNFGADGQPGMAAAAGGAHAAGGSCGQPGGAGAAAAMATGAPGNAPPGTADACGGGGGGGGIGVVYVHAPTLFMPGGSMISPAATPVP